MLMSGIRILWLTAAVLALGAAVARADAGPALTVNAGAGRHPISPNIYGINNADPALAAQIALPVDRWGGENLEAYNWKIGAINTGRDYFFENIPDCNSPAYSYCAHGRVFLYRHRVASDRRLGAATLLGLPMMGYVAKDGHLHPPFNCAFERSAYPRQQRYDPFSKNCGNGISAKTKRRLPATTPPSTFGKRIGPGFDAAWVRDLEHRYGDAAHGGVRFYELGNEPFLWDSIHRPLHPKPTTYDELWTKSRGYGAAVKAADPSAQILGFSEFAFDGYFCSAADNIASGGCTPHSPDRRRHGGQPLVEWLLSNFRADERRTGRRILDYIDVHYYAARDPSPAAHSPEITRSLWDPTYDDPSYISRDLHERVDVIPRMHDWVARDYPGTKISLSEYDLSHAPDDRTNGVIEADVLGIFAREQLDLATMYYNKPGNHPVGSPAASSAIADAFCLYRNYDGNHSGFGETYVSSASADQSKLSVYGARRASDGALTVAVVNKTDAPLTSVLHLANFSAAPTAHLWESDGAGIHPLPNEPVAAPGVAHTYPAKSMTMVVLAPA
jgi:hypothetical protein